MTDSNDHLIQEATVSISRDGDTVSFELQGTELRATGRHGEDHEAVPVLG
jgi:hypothetical protein